MGTILSLPIGGRGHAGEGHHEETSRVESSKRLRMSPSSFDGNPRLIAGLPDEISLQILARLPRICYMAMRSVSRGWKAAVMSSEVFELRKELGCTEEWLYLLTKIEEDRLVWHALDPLSRRWQRLPPMPSIVSAEDSRNSLSRSWMWNFLSSNIKIADVMRGWLGQRDALDRLPFCGCAIGAVDGCLFVLGGFSRASAMKCVWRFDPSTNNWEEADSMATGRAFCKTGVLNNKLYAVGGVSRGRGGLTPLQSAEVYDPGTGVWKPLPSMPFSKAQVLPAAFLAEMLKPIATGMTCYRGKLCVPQSLYSWPFFVDVGGEVYDPETDAWMEMPAGMGEGWPARQAGTKLSVVVDGELYALDPSSSLDNGKINMYSHQDDAWKVVIGKVPIHDLADSESPYLLASFLGKLHVITKDVHDETIILQADLPRQLRPPTSSSSSTTNSCGLSVEEENDVWHVIATKNLGTAELVGCQVLDV